MVQLRVSNMDFITRRKRLNHVMRLGVVYIGGLFLLYQCFKSLSDVQKTNHEEHFKVNNQKRVVEAVSFLSDIKALHEKEKRDRNEIGNVKCQLSISIITMSRVINQTDSEQPHYLLQSAAALIKLTNQLDQNKFQIHLSVCNVDLYPGRHVDINYINKWMTVFQRDNNERITYKSRYEKELLDYVFCMKNILEQNSSFVLIIEDDAIANPDLFTVLEKELFENEKCELKNEKFHDLFYIKLHTNSWDLNFIRHFRWIEVLFITGYDIERILELVLLTLILDVAIAIMYRTCTRKRFSYHMLIVLFIYIAWILNIIGRQNISTAWRYILGKTHELANAPAGSFVAVLYPRAGAEATVRYLSSFECDKECPKDLVVNKLARKHWKQLLLIEPPLFTHIGYHSTKRLTSY